MSHSFPDKLFKDIDFTFTDEHRLKLGQYDELLHKWQKAINLVSKNTLSESWLRHIVDSAQIAPYIRDYLEEIKSERPMLIDIGSGAGFPAMVLAIMFDSLDVNVIESDSKKCSFIRTVSRETSAPINIYNERIEKVISEGADDKILACNIITARALASLSELLSFAEPILQKNPNLRLFLPKGQKADQEIGEAQESYEFEYKMHKSLTDPYGCILEVYNVKPRQ